jgi:hypothetical protein
VFSVFAARGDVVAQSPTKKLFGILVLATLE